MRLIGLKNYLDLAATDRAREYVVIALKLGPAEEVLASLLPTIIAFMGPSDSSTGT